MGSFHVADIIEYLLATTRRSPGLRRQVKAFAVMLRGRQERGYAAKLFLCGFRAGW